MKVAELRSGMLIRPVEGMKWMKRQNTLCVEPLERQTFGWGADVVMDMGVAIAMYVESLPFTSREKVANLKGSWGARVVMLGGLLIAVDQSAGHRIEPVSK